MRLAGLRVKKLTTDSLIRVILCLYFVISIFEPYLNGILGSITKYYMFFVMLVLLWRDGFVLKLRRLCWPYIIWLVFLFVSLLWTENYYIFRLHFISQIGMVLYMVILLSSRRDEKTLESIIDVYWLSSLIMGLLSVFFSSAYHGTVDSRQILVIMNVEVDPNNQAALLLIGIAISAVNILYLRRKVWISVAGLLINVYSCFITSSRAALVAVVAVGLFCVLYSHEKIRFNSVFMRLATIGIAVCVVYVITVNFLPEAGFDRLFDFSTYKGGSDRNILWGKAWKVFSEDLLTVLMGAGWGTYYAYLRKAVHNTFLAMLCDVGLLGTLLFVVPIIIIALRLLKRKEPMPVLLLGAEFIPAFFIDSINKRFFWNAILILFMYYFIDSRHSSDEGKGTDLSC